MTGAQRAAVRAESIFRDVADTSDVVRVSRELQCGKGETAERMASSRAHLARAHDRNGVTSEWASGWDLFGIRIVSITEWRRFEADDLITRDIGFRSGTTRAVVSVLCSV